jgi:anti-anti-sigma regulatory factor
VASSICLIWSNPKDCCQSGRDIARCRALHYRFAMVLELSGVSMIASAGMGAMIALRRDAARFGGKVRLAAPQVREALRRALFDRIFEFHDTIDQASVIS